jgi:hypothetical protein
MFFPFTPIKYRSNYIQTVVFQDVMSCKFVVKYQHIRGTCCLHPQVRSVLVKDLAQLYRQAIQVIMRLQRGGNEISPKMLVSICQTTQHQNPEKCELDTALTAFRPSNLISTSHLIIFCLCNIWGPFTIL